MTFDEFFSEFSEQVEFVKDNDDYGWEEQDFFTSVILDYLEDVGEVESPVICPYRAYGVQMNAYVFSEDYEILTIYVSIYYLGNEIKSALKTDIDAA